MPYKNLINVGGLTEAQVWRHQVDWLTSRNGIADYSASGLGWTLHDYSYAVDADNPTVGDWVVLKSTGEGGKQALYIQLTFSTLANSIVRSRSGLSWNASTDAWTSAFPSSIVYHGPTSGTTFSLWIYGSLDKFVVIVGNGTALYSRFFGLPGETLYDSTIATTAGAVSSGSNVVVPVDSVPSSWAVGTAVIIRSETAIERAVIGAISGTDVTVTSLSNGYASGARVAADHVVLLSAASGGLGAFNAQIGRGGAVSISSNIAGTTDTSVIGAADPDQMNGRHVTDKIRLSLGSGTNMVGSYGALSDILVASTTGLTSGNTYQDDTGQSWRALLLSGQSIMHLFREV